MTGDTPMHKVTEAMVKVGAKALCLDYFEQRGYTHDEAVKVWDQAVGYNKTSDWVSCSRACLTAALSCAGESADALAKRPVAFRYKNAVDEWVLTLDEQEAQQALDTGHDYQGLYVRDGGKPDEVLLPGRWKLVYDKTRRTIIAVSDPDGKAIVSSPSADVAGMREALEPFAKLHALYPRPRLGTSPEDVTVAAMRGHVVTLAHLDALCEALASAPPAPSWKKQDDHPLTKWAKNSATSA